VKVVLALAVGFVAVRYLAIAGRDMLRVPVLLRANYRGIAVSTAGGILLIASALVIESGRSTLGAFHVGDLPGRNPARPLVLFACFGFGLLGLIDDLLGDSSATGFVGHLGALVRGRLTTGALKVIGGAAIALVLAASPGFITGKRLVADALLIALAANLANLLDRAPGRTIKCALLAYIPFAIVAGPGEVGMAVAPVMGAAAGVLGDDLRERIMLGDTGANVLGAVLGLGVVLDVGRGSRNAILVVLVVLNVAAELVSFTSIIDRVAPLRALDRLGRRKSGRSQTISEPPRTDGSTGPSRAETPAPARTRHAAGAQEGP
jgi:UDP-N-acetylmuramyl pentapeptide phosphotransferase/UDP-N-acetylglucosamine-1-phosphate transferase